MSSSLPTIIVKSFPRPSKSNPLVVYFISDLHLLSRGCEIEDIRRYIRRIKEENAYWVCLGDLGEMITASDWRFIAGRFDSLPDSFPAKDLDKIVFILEDEVIKLLNPIKSTGLCIMSGNHEDKWERTASYPLVERIAKQLNMSFLDYYGVLLLKFISEDASKKKCHNYYKILLHHGFGGGRWPGIKYSRMLEYISGFEGFDILATAHTHDVGVIKEAIHHLMLKNYETPQWQMRPMYLIKAGGFRGWARYAAKMGLRYKPPGCVRAKIYRSQEYGKEIYKTECTVI